MKTNLFQMKTLLFGRYGKALVLALPALIFCAAMMPSMLLAAVACPALEDSPLDTMEQKAPGIVMFVVDDSGSMDWEILCKGEDNGLFEGYGYIFNNPGDNLTNTGVPSPMEDKEADTANKWKSQWAGYNRLYYDPNETYDPWPGYDQADPDKPKADPVLDFTLDLTITYSDFGVSGGGLTSAAIIQAGGVIVDNKDSAGAGKELIIDNSGPVAPATGTFDLSGVSWSTWNTGEAYANSCRYMRSNGTGYANWRYSNLPAGKYDVYVCYGDDSYFSTSVKYSVYDDWSGGNEVTSHFFDQEHNGGDNPENDPDDWILLAADVSLEDSARITLKHYTNQYWKTGACADAVKLVPKFSVAQNTLFESSSGWRLLNDNGTYLDQYLESYADTKEFWARWTASNLDPDQIYNVYAMWDTSDSRQTDINYTTFCDGTDIVYEANQRNDDEKWMRIAEKVTFSSGEGIVELRENGNWYDFCADAVAFMPVVDIEDLNLIRAHYYTKGSDNEVYLVNLDGDHQYFQVDDKDNDDIVDGIDELIEKTEAEATAVGIYTGRSYTEERKNFANWYTYNRKRHLTAKNAIANVIMDMNGVYIGLHYINHSRANNYSGQSFRDSNSGSPALPVRVVIKEGEISTEYDQSQKLLDILYASLPGGGTPLREGLESAGKYFQGNDIPTPFPDPASKFSSTSFPFYNDTSGTCQQAFTILMTDGFWNGGFTLPTGMDEDQDGDGHEYTLADVAMYYYEEDLQPDIANNVPGSDKDTNNAQHMVTYSLSFGLDGKIDQSLWKYCPPTCPDWSDSDYKPVQNTSTTIDDLWHASVNGRGLYVNASTPQEMLTAMQQLGQDITDRLGSSAALATNSIQRQVGTVIYQGTYNTAGWFGDIKALKVNPGGSVDVHCADTSPPATGCWRASDGIPVLGDRNIISFDGTSSIDFFYGNLTPAQITLLGNNGHDVEDLVNYLRGGPADGFRVRANPIGDIVHSAPFFYNDVVYIGANDGMLHAVNANNGEELFCYVPNMVYDHLSDLALPNYSHKFYVDATATAAKVNAKEILVCGLGKGGKGYFGLDITAPGNPKALWEFTGDDDLGYSFSQVSIIRTQATDHSRVVMFGNGYESKSETAALFFVDPEDGTLVKKIDTGATGCNGLASPSAVDVDADGSADFVFAGDLLGNLWKFDIRDTDADKWKVYYGETDSQPLVSVRNAFGKVQPITTAPEVMLDCAKSNFSSKGAGLMVIFATGQYLNSADFEADVQAVQSFYGVWDWGDIWENINGYDEAKKKYLGQVGNDRSLSNVNAELQQQTTTVSGDWVIVSGNPVNWYDPIEDTGDMGWFIDLSADGERGVRDPAIIGNGVVELISVTPSSSPCESGGSSVIYRVSACSGGYTDDPQFDVNGDGKIDDDDKTVDASSYFDSGEDYNNDGVVDDEDLKAFLNYTDWNGDGVIDSNDLDVMKLPLGGKQMDNMIFEGISIGDQRYYSDTEGEIESAQKPPINLGMQYFRILQ